MGSHGKCPIHGFTFSALAPMPAPRCRCERALAMPADDEILGRRCAKCGRAIALEPVTAPA